MILVQPENEYSFAVPGIEFPNHRYFEAVEDQLRAAGIVVPFVSNDAAPLGLFAPGNGTGEVQIYGHDSYPLGFDCANPYQWPNGALPTYYHTLHLKESPSTPYTISEFQGGSFDPWGGSSFAKCAILLNDQFERVFNKNDYSAGIAILNIYMVCTLTAFTELHLTSTRFMVGPIGEISAIRGVTHLMTTALLSRKSDLSPVRSTASSSLKPAS